MLEKCQNDDCDNIILSIDRWFNEINEENQDWVSQMMTWKDEHDNSNDDQCWYCDKLKFLELCFTAAAEKTFLTSNDW